jgi:hypothetical protein
MLLFLVLHFVSKYMMIHSSFMFKHLAAFTAWVRLVLGMYSSLVLQQSSRYFIMAATHITSVWCFTSMEIKVNLQKSPLCKCFATITADKGLFSGIVLTLHMFI